jgi:hypothetical protein
VAPVVKRVSGLDVGLSITAALVSIGAVVSVLLLKRLE